MRGLIQLVTHASVDIDNITVGSIQKGLLVLIGMDKKDTVEAAEQLFNRIIHYRIFPDDQGKMNLSLKNVEGGILLVPQFTLVADTSKGLRPGFSVGMGPVEGKRLFEHLVHYAKGNYPYVASGMFGADMKVSLCNDGPVTFLLEI